MNSLGEIWLVFISFPPLPAEPPPEHSLPSTAQAPPVPPSHRPGETLMLKYWATAWQAQEQLVKGMLCQICVIY